MVSAAAVLGVWQADPQVEAERGGELLSEPADMPWGARVFRLRDPDGFLWELSSREPARMAPASESPSPGSSSQAASFSVNSSNRWMTRVERSDGSCTFSAPRRSIVAHCMSAAARFDAHATSPVYSRYRQAGSRQMDESFFPVLWREDGYRSGELKGQVYPDVAAALTSAGRRPLRTRALAPAIALAART